MQGRPSFLFLSWMTHVRGPLLIWKGKWKTDLLILLAAAAAAKSLQSCPTLCDPTDSSPPGSPISGILQARTLEWVAISFSNAWKWKLKVKPLSCFRLLVTPWTASYQAPPSMGFSRQDYWSGVSLPSPDHQLGDVNCILLLSSTHMHTHTPIPRDICSQSAYMLMASCVSLLKVLSGPRQELGWVAASWHFRKTIPRHVQWSLSGASQ